jgi:hypothetical protein
MSVVPFCVFRTTKTLIIIIIIIARDRPFVPKVAVFNCVLGIVRDCSKRIDFERLLILLLDRGLKPIQSRNRRGTPEPPTSPRAGSRTAGAPGSASITASGANTRTAGAPASASITARGAPARTAGAPASASITPAETFARTAGAPVSASVTASGAPALRTTGRQHLQA